MQEHLALCFDDRYEAAFADLEICHIRRIPGTIRPSPTVGQRNRTAVFFSVKAEDTGQRSRANCGHGTPSIAIAALPVLAAPAAKSKHEEPV
jgi:hypothetical protein